MTWTELTAGWSDSHKLALLLGSLAIVTAAFVLLSMLVCRSIVTIVRGYPPLPPLRPQSPPKPPESIEEACLRQYGEAVDNIMGTAGANGDNAPQCIEAFNKGLQIIRDDLAGRLVLSRTDDANGKAVASGQGAGTMSG